MQFIPCSHQRPRTSHVELIVIHTNEGPEGPNSAEGLAQYLARPDVVPGYHFVVDENSVVQCAQTNMRVNGAGGVNDKSVHICITGYAAQSAAQWDDPASRGALALAEDLARTQAKQLGVPWVRIDDPRSEWGICGHADVSRYFDASMGHTDPGANFPWDSFLAGNFPPAPSLPDSLEGMTEFFWRDPKTTTIYHFAGNSNHALTPGNKALITLAAARETEPGSNPPVQKSRRIVDLGDLNPKQVEDMLKFPTTR